jgi:thiosulfate/3-mercaptopyruvate sulfurtransferase
VHDDSRVVVVFDQPNAFTRASRAFFTLEWAGLTGRVAVLDGGLPKWQRDGRAVATGTGRAARAGMVTLAPDPTRRATTADVLAAIADPGTQVVDARDSVFYLDSRPNGMPRGGHIASAVSLPFSTVTASDGTLKPRADLEALVRGAGIGDDERVVSYCHIGMQASWMYLTLRVLGRDVRMFDGSFDEWSRDAGLPVEGERP